jgi:Protein of unknown function (DUF3891)
MLLHLEGNGVVCIGQAAHSWVSGRLARAWTLGRPEPFAEVCLGAEQHDIGMADWDRRPELDPDTGYPLSFLRLPLATHIALWTEAPEKLLAQSPYAALLISMHGHALFAKRTPTPEIERYLAEQEAFQTDLLERLGADAEQARRNQQLVWALDHLALVGLIPEWAPQDNTVGDLTLHVEIVGERRVSVDPWPFESEEITLNYPGRRLTEPSTTEPELHARLAAAPWVDVHVTWVRP